MIKARVQNDATSAIDLAIDQAVDLRRLLKGAHTRLAGCTADEIYRDICLKMTAKHASWEPCATRLRAMAVLIEQESTPRVDQSCAALTAHQPRARHSGRLGRSTPSVESSPWPG
jgi:hypothetical protein